MITNATPTRHFAWFGVELVSLRRPRTATRLDGAAETTAARRLLDALRVSGLNVTIEIRYWRDPGGQGLRSALLGRVDGRAADAVMGRAHQLESLLGSFELANTASLDDGQLLAWLRGAGARTTWAVAGRRRLLAADAALPDLWYFRVAEPTNAAWHRALDALLGSPGGVVGVRVRPAPDAVGSGAMLDALLGQFHEWASPGYDRAAAELGRIVQRAPAQFAIDAVDALEGVRRQWSAQRFEIAFTLAGRRAPDELVPWAEALTCGPTARRSDPSPLEFVGAHAGDFDVARAMQTLDVDVPRRSARIPPDVVRLADSYSVDETIGLFHLPSNGPPPTPGVPIATEPEVGLPADPYAFISYNRIDTELARAMAGLLTAWSLPAWWDERIAGGTDWRRELDAALSPDRCRALVVLVTERAGLSEWVRREMALAAERGIPIIQVLLAPSPLVDERMQAIDLTGWDGGLGDGRLVRLRRDLDAIFGSPGAGG